jgi:hypothetical protein
MAFGPSRIFYVLYEEGGAYCLLKKRMNGIKEAIKGIMMILFL